MTKPVSPDVKSETKKITEWEGLELIQVFAECSLQGKAVLAAHRNVQEHPSVCPCCLCLVTRSLSFSLDSLLTGRSTSVQVLLCLCTHIQVALIPVLEEETVADVKDNDINIHFCGLSF